MARDLSAMEFSRTGETMSNAFIVVLTKGTRARYTLGIELADYRLGRALSGMPRWKLLFF